MSETKCGRSGDCRCGANSGAFYGLGMIGAAIFFIGKAATFGAGVLGLFKAIIWPVFFVYEVLSFLIK